MILLLVFAIGLCAQHESIVSDVAADFSLTKNPNGVWQYGYSETESLEPDQFRFDADAQKVGLIGFWHPFSNQGPGPGYYPYVAYNTTNETQLGSQNGWAVRGGQIAMEASNTGQYSLARFVVPATGVYHIEARFEGIHFGLSTTDVHVRHNAKSLFDAYIEGYGGDARFHKIEGLFPSASFDKRVPLTAKDTITFAVGYGRNKTHFSDTTGLTARITPAEASLTHK
jgi:hypothetical protein